MVHTLCIFSFAEASANVHPQPLVRAKRLCDRQLICGALQQVYSKAKSKVVEAEHPLLQLVVHTMCILCFAIANANVHPQPLVQAKSLCDRQHCLLKLICEAR